MKIRSSFLSNSSSTSYIVAIPIDFDFAQDWIEKIVIEAAEREGLEIEDDEMEIVDKIIKVLKSIRRSSVKYQDQIEGVIGEFAGISLIGDILDSLGLCLSTLDASSDGGIVMNVLSPKIKDKLKDVLKQHKTCLE